MKKILYFVIARGGRYDPFHSTISSCTFITMIQTHKWILLGPGSRWIEHKPACSFAHYLLNSIFSFSGPLDYWAIPPWTHRLIDWHFLWNASISISLKIPSSKHHIQPYDFELLSFRVYFSSSNTMSKFSRNAMCVPCLYIWDLPETRDNLAGTMQVQARAGARPQKSFDDVV